MARFELNWADGFVYFIESGEYVKIGWSGDVQKRLDNLHGASPFELTLLGQTRGTRAYERALHEKFKHLRHKREWFKKTQELLLAVSEICGEAVDKQTALA